MQAGMLDSVVSSNSQELFDFNARHNGEACIESLDPKDRGTERQFRFTGYYPDNVHFVTPRENTRNRERTVRLADGMSLADYAETVGIEVRRNGRITNEYAKLYRHFKQGHLLMREDLVNYPVIPYI